MHKLRILLVEDDADDRNFFSFFLKDREDLSLLAPLENGVGIIEALEKFKHSNNLPHLIILDQNMPVRTGLQTLQTIKEKACFAEIPVMMYSTYVTAELKKNSLRYGALHVIQKPCDKQGYYKMIDSFLEAVL